MVLEEFFGSTLDGSITAYNASLFIACGFSLTGEPILNRH